MAPTSEILCGAKNTPKNDEKTSHTSRGLILKKKGELPSGYLTIVTIAMV